MRKIVYIVQSVSETPIPVAVEVDKETGIATAGTIYRYEPGDYFNSYKDAIKHLTKMKGRVRQTAKEAAERLWLHVED